MVHAGLTAQCDWIQQANCLIRLDGVNHNPTIWLTFQHQLTTIHASWWTPTSPKVNWNLCCLIQWKKVHAKPIILWSVTPRNWNRKCAIMDVHSRMVLSSSPSASLESLSWWYDSASTHPSCNMAARLSKSDRDFSRRPASAAMASSLEKHTRK